jgi:flavin-dependent dehydrogenase
MEALGVSQASHFDLIVIGAGPAGTSAAITAARGGAQVLLCERGRLPRQRVCGEFVSAESLELLATLLADRAPALIASAPRISSARLFAEGHIISTVVDPAAASIARIDVDLALWNAAAHLGVRTLSQTIVEQIEGSGPFQIASSAGQFSASAIINATGRWSNLTRPGAQPHDRTGARWLGVKAHFAEPDPPPSVDLYFFEGGYCGVQPVRVVSDIGDCNRVNACAMVRSDVATSLPEVFALHPALAERSRGWRQIMEPVSTSPLVFREPAPLWNGLLLAGDSAGFVDPFVGDGISLALRSGAGAAQCLLPFFRGEITRSEAEQHYLQAYRQRLMPIFRNSQRLRRLFTLPRPVRKPLAFFFEHTPAFTSYLVSKTR